MKKKSKTHYCKMNEFTYENGVRTWESPNDANYNNFHAEYDGVEFFRFPFSPYSARLGWHMAVISTHMSSPGATLYKCHPNGDSTVLKSFSTRDFQDAVKMAVDELKAMEDKGD